MRPGISLLFALFAVAGGALSPPSAAPARAEAGFDGAVRDTLGGDPAAYRAFVATLQAAIRSGDAAGVAALVSYPITVTIDGAPRGIADARAFVAAYPSIVTRKIAAAVADEPLSDMLVNAQGVMLGQGEIWLTGVCAASDTACARPEIKVIAIQPADGLAPAGPAAAPGVTRSFGDWVAGCDNYRACVAIGMMPDQEAGAYVVIRRGGGARDAPSVAFSFPPQGDMPAHPKLRVAIAGGAGAPPGVDMPVTARDGFLTATAAPDRAPDLIAALMAGHGLTLTALDGGAPGEAAAVSLKGSAAALLYLDDQQRRVGTTTALARPGPARPDTIPAVDLTPVWRPAKITALPDPPPPPPAGVAPAPDDSCGQMAPLAFSVGPDTTLWGVCALAAAYNIDYDFWIAGPDGVRKADFTIPGQPAPEDPAALTNPNLNPDGRSLNTMALGRGPGDCGTIADWGWDGTAPRLVGLRDMPECRGVDSSDWPVLFRADPS